MEHSEGTFTAHDGVVLVRQRWAPQEDARAVLALVHGIGEHSSRYPRLVQHLSERGFVVHGFDLRGHGRSAGKRGHVNAWEDYRQDIRQFLDLAKAEGKPLFLMGHSLGGLMALNYAILNPQGLAGVVASAPALAQESASPGILLLARILSVLMPEFSLPTGLDASAISRDPEVVRAYSEDALVHGVASARFAREMMLTMNWTNAHAADLTMPLLILHGTADRIVPADAVRTFYEHAASVNKKMVSYPGGYHEAHNDLHADQAVRDVGDWLEELIPS